MRSVGQRSSLRMFQFFTNLFKNLYENKNRNKNKNGFHPKPVEGSLIETSLMKNAERRGTSPLNYDLEVVLNIFIEIA